MDNRSLKALEYYKILDKLSDFCVNEAAKEQARELEPSTDKAEVEELQKTLDEAVGMLLRNGNAPIARNEDISDYLSRASIGSVLSMAELLSIASVLRTVDDLKGYYKDDLSYEGKVESPALSSLFEGLESCKDLEKSISRKILGPNEMADTASRQLSEIRREINLKNRRISEQLDRIVSLPDNEKVLQEKLVSMRNGRYVVPVKAEHRQKIPGAVIDRSSSGSTIFIEPLAILELNNELRELEVQEHREIERILKELSKEVRTYEIEIRYDYETLTQLDFLFAKANFALQTGLNRVHISEDNTIDFKKARHPLIEPEKVVASDVALSPNIHTLVITGPNTGGKTVTLKTLGLLSAMFQSGLYLPVKEGSVTRVFSNIFADIGDEQSIEQNLSTFSSHMTNIVSILEEADQEALVLFDELGAGTDPVEGAALAVSILDTLRSRGTLTAATTHYAEIKEFALSEDDVLNASVEFDVKTLQPTYRLMLGLPGKSNAFEIASRLGLPNEIIDKSRQNISGGQKKFEDTIAAAQEEMITARNEREAARRVRVQAEELLKKVQAEKESIEKRKEKILTKAGEQAQKLVEDTKKETESIYREIQKIQREAAVSVDNKKLESLRASLSKEEKRIQKKKQKAVPKSQKTNYKITDFTKGDRVYIKSLDREADVTNVLEREKKVEITSGAIRMKLKPNDLVIVQKKKPKSKVQVVRNKSSKGQMSTRLDLRGKTVEETRMLIDDFINEAVLLGQEKVEIIHGFGTGQVRKAVHDYLKKSKLISSYRLGGPGEGGAGATIVNF